MTAIAGVNRVFYKGFLFRVEIDGVISAAFQDCSPVTMETGDIDQWEGGALIPNKSPGRVTVANITLKRGATDDRQLWDWFQQTVASAAMLADPDFKRNLDIIQFNRQALEIQRYTLFNAYPRRWGGGTWDNNADANLVEEVELRYDFPQQGGDSPT